MKKTTALFKCSLLSRFAIIRRFFHQLMCYWDSFTTHFFW